MFARLRHGPRDRDRSTLKPRQRIELVVRYLPDWIVTIVLVALVGYFASGERKGLKSFKREFSLTDTSIQHTFAENERISFGAAIGIAGGIPVGIIVLCAVLWRRSFWDAHNGLLGLVLSCAITTSITELIKSFVGRPRPDMIDRCQPIAGAANRAVYGLSTVAICSIDPDSHLLTDGFKSFPSGHASFSFAGLGFLSFYLAGKMHLFDRSGHAIKAWIAMIPLMGAALISITRTMDYRHHATDVLIGGLLGFFMSFFTYHLYYPPLSSHKSHLPFAPSFGRRSDSSGVKEPSVPGTVERPLISPTPVDESLHPNQHQQHLEEGLKYNELHDRRRHGEMGV